MANSTTLSGLAPLIYKNFEVITKPLAGAITSSMVNSSDVGLAAIGDTVESFTTSDPTIASSYTPAMTIPAAGDLTTSKKTFAISQTAQFDIPLNGEARTKLLNSWGPESVYNNALVRGLRKVIRQMEAYHIGVIYKAACRAVGVAGTTPFGSNFNVLYDLLKIFEDNEVDTEGGELSCILNTAAKNNLSKIAQLQKVNESGDRDLLRRGQLSELAGFILKLTGGSSLHTKGTATGYDLTAGFAVGDETLTVDGSDAGTILAGDVVQFASDGNNYVVNSATASGAASGNIVLNEPGLVAALDSADEGVTGANYTPNVAFHRGAVEFAMRPPALPEGGDAADDYMTFMDEGTGLVFQIAEYKGYKMNKLDVVMHYDSKVWESNHVATLMG